MYCLLSSYGPLIPSHQGELEHRTAKSRYARTSRKAYIKQLAAIERRQTHLRRIRERLAKAGNLASESVPKDMDASYQIGKSQNHPVAIAQFLHKHDGDPAVKVRCPLVLERLLWSYLLPGLYSQTQGTYFATYQGIISRGIDTGLGGP